MCNRSRNRAQPPYQPTGCGTPDRSGGEGGTPVTFEGDGQQPAPSKEGTLRTATLFARVGDRRDPSRVRQTSGRQFSQNIRDTCSERAFYDDAQLDSLSGKSQSLEKFFHGFEDAGAKVIRETLDSIRADSFSVLSECARVDLGIFLGIQQLRTKRARADAGALMEAICKQQFLAYIRRTQPELLVDESWLEMEADERARFGAQFHLVTDEEARVSMSAVFLNRHWWFLRNRAPKGFYTSDHPIVEHGDVTPEASSLATTLVLNAASTFGETGIFRRLLPVLLTGVLSVGPIVAFPLAPDVVLVMLDTNCASLDGRLQNMLNASDLKFYNGLQTLQSHRQVYSRDRL
jgi:hypothetical protein